MSAISADRWAKLSPYLDRLLDLAPEERAAWLESLRGQDPALASDLAALSVEREALERAKFLEGEATRMALLGTLAGHTFGAYTLISPIGHGGMGSVWLARRSDGRFEGQAAVKLLNPALIGGSGADRFRREGTLLAKLKHPNIAHLIDAGVSAAGQPYLVLEYIEGQPIDEYCDARQLDVDARVRLFLDVLAAVGDAHRHLIIHRDIKPSNVYVTREGVVKLLDFGVAKLLEADVDASPATLLTKEGGRALTPAYAAPEQLVGQPVTTATDVYSLGVVLYALLAGRHPTAPADGSSADLLHAVLETEPARLSDAVTDRAQTGPTVEQNAASRASTPGALRHRLRGDLDNILLKALKKDAAERYATVAAFAEDLRRYLAHEPVAARPDTVGYRVAKFARRNRGAVIAASVVLITLVAAVAITASQMVEARRQRDAAQVQQKRAEAEARFVNLMMSEVGPGGRPLSMTEMLDRGQALLDREYGDDPRFVAENLLQISGRYMDLGATDKELAALTRAEAIARRLGDPLFIAKIQCNTVDTEIAAGNTQKARERLEEAERLLAQSHDVAFGERVDCLNAAASVAEAQGDTEGAIEKAKAAASMLERAGDTSDVQYSSFLSHIGYLYQNLGQFKESFKWSERAVQNLERTGRAGTQGLLIELHNEALSLLAFGELRSACERERETIDRAHAANPDQPLAPAVTLAFGSMLERLDKPEEGLSWIDQSLRDAIDRQNVPQQIWAHAGRGRALMHAGRFDEASAEYDAAEKLGRTDAIANRAPLMRVTWARAELDYRRGNIGAARKAMGELLGSLGYPQQTQGPRIANILILAARIELAAGDPGHAARLATDALRVATDVARKPEDSADVGEASLVLAQAQAARGDIQSARVSVERALPSLTNGLGPEHSRTREALELRDSLVHR
jgi:serine/threonine-protein kinase